MARKTRRKVGSGKNRGGKPDKRPSTSRTAGSSGRISAAARAARRAAARSGAGTPARDAPGVAPPVDEDANAPIDLSILKSGKLYYRIGEVSQITGVKPYVLRYWESEFRLMAPQKSRSKQRLYRQKDIETILHIKRLLYEERYTIAGARQRLRELGAAGVRASGPSEATARSEKSEKESQRASEPGPAGPGGGSELRGFRDELIEIRSLLSAEL
jgi:DNA-binding transcriptional MerR regulator